MTEVGFGELVVRMVISLAVVLGLMFGGYLIMRRKQGYGGSSATRAPRRSSGGSSRRSQSAGNTSTKGANGNRRGLRIVGRLGIGRTSQVIAVQFAEKVFLVGACDATAPQVLAEMDLAAWLLHVEADDEATVVREAIVPGAPARPASLIDSLREATARRA
ncbi:MAG: flagellar biosynthetic protein FliO [Ilumatobacteraceae bacterium]